MVRRCKAKTISGSPCSATPVRDDGYCYWHSPALAAERDEARRRGGSARSNQARARKQMSGLNDMTDVKARLMVALAKVEEGELEPGPANAMANLARAIATVAGVADFEGQLAELRRDVAELAESRGA
jgi:hypothetical protein